MANEIHERRVALQLRTRTRVRELIVCAALIGCVQVQSLSAVADAKAQEPTADLSRWEASAPVIQAIDFDRDGRDELVFEGGFGMGGQYSRGVTIAAFGEEWLVELGAASVYESVCGTGREDVSGPTSAKISVVPDTGLVIERFSQASCESEDWEPVGGAEPLVLIPSEENPFEDISRSPDGKNVDP